MASTAELEAQILAEMENNQEAYADTGIEYCTVDDTTRIVTVPECYKTLGVESDEKAKRVWFRFPKIVSDNKDLSMFDIRINYYNANSEADIYQVEDMSIDGDYIVFSWELSRKVTKYKNGVGFVVCAVKPDSEGNTEREWNTTLNKDCKVLEGFEASAQIEEENPEIIEYILAQLKNATTISPEDIANAVQEYMTAHPFTETDPTVPEWAKNPTKPEYTASEVGALPDTMKIPSKTSDLQNDSGFISAPATAEAGQVLEVLSVDDSGKPTAWRTVTLKNGIAIVEMTTSDTVVTLEPEPKVYIFPEMASLTVSRTAGREKELYHFKFASGETATAVTLVGAEMSNNSASVAANKVYEVDILDGIAVVTEMADYTPEVHE